MKSKKLLSLTLTLVGSATVINAQKLPNIILIFCDDMGYGDLCANNATGFITPNLERLAAEGMRFTNFYAAQAVSSASRIGLLTGCYPNRVGFSGALAPDAKIGINPEEETIAEILKTKAYATAAVGKWHLGRQTQFLPLQNGFDEYFGIPYSNDMWPIGIDGKRVEPTSRKYNYPDLPILEGNNIFKTLKNLEDQSEITRLYTERAVSFIHKNRKKPFFLYLAHSMPHVPLAVSAKFKGKSQQGLYGDVMMEIDWSVGQVMEALKKERIDKNTLIVFTSDNGPWLNYGNHAGSAGGLREGKGTSFEGGQRVPCLMKWPKQIPAGTVCNKLSATIDLLPTFASITGAKLPAKKIDGLNIISLLKNESNANPRENLLYYYNENSLEAVRKGNWKLVLPHSGRSYVGQIPGNDGNPGKTTKITTGLELYDLRRDPGEQYNVMEQNPEVVKELQILVDSARIDLGDDITNCPGKNRREPGRENK